MEHEYVVGFRARLQTTASAALSVFGSAAPRALWRGYLGTYIQNAIDPGADRDRLASGSWNATIPGAECYFSVRRNVILVSGSWNAIIPGAEWYDNVLLI